MGADRLLNGEELLPESALNLKAMESHDYPDLPVSLPQFVGPGFSHAGLDGEDSVSSFSDNEEELAGIVYSRRRLEERTEMTGTTIASGVRISAMILIPCYLVYRLFKCTRKRAAR